jgi:hypothetical protein
VATLPVLIFGTSTHRIKPEELGTAFEGLLKKKEEYLSVVLHWKAQALGIGH